MLPRRLPNSIPVQGAAMSTTAVGRCSQCQAIVNVHWQSCLVCKAILPQPEVPGSLSGPADLVTSLPPSPPLQRGWIVAYRDREGHLCGGSDDRAHGTVQSCEWARNGWAVLLTDGQCLPIFLIRSVGQTDANGKLRAAWTVRECGFDGLGGKDAKGL
jgi:hypothetical protein